MITTLEDDDYITYLRNNGILNAQGEKRIKDRYGTYETILIYSGYKYDRKKQSSDRDKFNNIG